MISDPLSFDGNDFLPPTPVIAVDERSAGVRAVMSQKAAIQDGDLARVEVLVRPFCVK